MFLKVNDLNKLKCCQMGALLGTSAMLVLAGCSGGSDGGGSGGGNANSGLPSANLVALTDNNRLLSFNSRRPGSATTINVTNLTSGDTLKAIDYRFTPPGSVPGNGVTGLYAIGQNGTSHQIYTLSSTGVATTVGARFVVAPAPTSFGFDFNPTVDRIRVIEPTQNRNLRLNPNDGTTVAADGNLAYAGTDANAGQDADGVAAAYTNVDANDTTGTTLYVLDAARNTLTTQGRADDPATVGIDEMVSPNSGTLFTVANLGVDITESTGFDIPSTSDVGFLSIGNRIYGINVAPGATRGLTTGGASVNASGGSQIIGLAVTL